MLWIAYGDHMTRRCGQPWEAKRGPQAKAVKKMGTSGLQLKELNSTNSQFYFSPQEIHFLYCSESPIITV